MQFAESGPTPAIQPSSSHSNGQIIHTDQQSRPTEKRNFEHDSEERPLKRRRDNDDSTEGVDTCLPVAIHHDKEGNPDADGNYPVSVSALSTSSLHSDPSPNESSKECHTSTNSQSKAPLHGSVDSMVDQIAQDYGKNVIQIQYPFADDSVRIMIYETAMSHGVLRDTASLLVSVHQQRSMKPGLIAFQSEETQSRIKHLQSLLESHNPCTSPDDAMAALNVISSYLFDGRSGPWERWLHIPYQYIDYLFLKHGGPSEALMQCSVKDVFIIKTSIWFDVMASVTTRKSPHFLFAIRTIFNLRQTEMFNNYSNGTFSMMSLLGCHDEVIWALAEISHLSHWKQAQLAEHCLSIPSLIKRATLIDEVLASSRAEIYASEDIHGCRVLASEIFRSSARLYLETVLSGNYPLVPEIRECVQSTIECMQRLDSPPSNAQLNGQRMSQSIVQNTMFSFFVCGALAEKEEHCDVIKNLLDREGDRVGNWGSTQTLFKQLWEMKEGTWSASDSSAPWLPDAVDWRNMLSDAKILLA